MINKNEQTFLKKKLPLYIKMASSVSLVVGAMGSLPTYAADSTETEEIVITGQRASIQSAQAIKKNADNIVDSIVADDMGKLPDRSVTEALQRIPGVTVTHFDALGDPEHFSAEGTGVAVRGLTQIRTELNGRDIFSASSGGRGLSFEDVPAELMAGVDVAKSPTADMIEGGLGGIVNLRTRMPFDTNGQEISLTAKASYAQSIDNVKPAYSGLYTNQWETEIGKIGFLVDLSTGETNTRTDGVYTREWHPRTDLVANKTVYVPRGVDWRRVDFSRDRTGAYTALQWAPTDDLSFYLTAFRSKYNLRWDENAAFLAMDSGDIKHFAAYGSSALTFDDSGHFVSGKLTTIYPEYNNASNGITFGVDTRASTRDSATTDISTGFKYSPDDHWEFSGDLQSVKAHTKGLDNTIALAMEPAYADLDLSGHLPSISIPGDLTNPSNYMWSFTMPHVVNNKADEYAARIDAKYSVDDSIIKSVKAGARFTDRTADNEESDYHWTAMYQPWLRGTADWQPNKPGYKFPTLTNTEDVSVFTFNDFYRGAAHVPTSVLVPKLALIDAYPSGINELRERAGFVNSAAIPDMTLPRFHNDQEEKTSAIYATAAFAFEDLALPVDGNLGVRLVKTENTATGYLSWSDQKVKVTIDGTPTELENPFWHPAEYRDIEKSYTNVLPNFNLRVKLTEDLLLRFAAAKAISRPEFSSLAANINLSPKLKTTPVNTTNLLAPENFDYSFTNDANPFLKPMESTQFDVSLEWYFNESGGEIHANAFQKDVDQYITNSTVPSTFGGDAYMATWPINSGDASLTGVELGWTQFFDALPSPFDGVGLSGNYTYIDSETHVTSTSKPVDTDGSTYSPLPYQGISRNSYNLVLMYEKYGVSARLAYNWRSSYLMSFGANGYNGHSDITNVNWSLPVYANDFGQLDGSIGYKFNDNVSMQLAVSNITNAETTTSIKQNAAGNHTAAYFVNDTRYDLSLSVKF